jgi:fructose-6-phosphate aldolase 2
MLLADTADPAELAWALALPGVSGFTTNPALIAKAAGAERLSAADYRARALALCVLARDRGVRTAMIQGVGAPETILALARACAGAMGEAGAGRLWIKLAPDAAALGLIPSLKALGCRTLVTAVFTGAQALVAAEAGADGVAVYLGRLMRAEAHWCARMDAIAAALGEGQTMLLLASFPDVATVEAGLAWSRDLTLPPAVLGELLASSASAAAIAALEGRVGPA